MEPAVSTVLAGVICQVTAWGDLRDWWSLPGFQANRKPAFQAGGVPHSRRNPWQPQATGCWAGWLNIVAAEEGDGFTSGFSTVDVVFAPDAQLVQNA